MTELKPEYLELKSKEIPPVMLECPVEFRDPSKFKRKSYLLYNSLVSLELTISTISLVFYVALNFSPLFIASSIFGTLAVCAGCFFSYLAISRVDYHKQTYALIAFCLSAILCFSISVFSLNSVFREYEPVSSLTFYGKSAENGTIVVTQSAAPQPPPKPCPVIQPKPTDPEDGYTDSTSENNTSQPDEPYPGKLFANAGDPGISIKATDYPELEESKPLYSYSTSYSYSYTYSYSNPYPYSISYSYTYSTSSSPSGPSYSIFTSSSYDNYSPYGQPSYSTQYSYSSSSGKENGNSYANTYPFFYPSSVQQESQPQQPSSTSSDRKNDNIMIAYAPIHAAPLNTVDNVNGADNVNKSGGVNSTNVIWSVLLVIGKVLIFVALITQAHDLRSTLKEEREAKLEESVIKSGPQIIAVSP